MEIEIDQSGKLEETARPTVVAVSNHIKRSICVSSTEKKKLQKYFRDIGKRQQYVYKTFATLIAYLLKDRKIIPNIIIDIEYPGHESLIKLYLLEILRETGFSVDRRDILFRQIGKESGAHKLAYKGYLTKKVKKITAGEIITIIKNKKIRC